MRLRRPPSVGSADISPAGGENGPQGRGGSRAAALAAGLLALAACAPDEPAPDPAAETEAEAAALERFDAVFAGRWAMSTDCPPDRMFVLTAERFEIDGMTCEPQSFSLDADGDVRAPATCEAEGRTLRVADRRFEFSDPPGDLVTVADGTAEWLLARCGRATRPPEGNIP